MITCQVYSDGSYITEIVSGTVIIVSCVGVEQHSWNRLPGLPNPSMMIASDLVLTAILVGIVLLQILDLEKYFF